MLLSQGGDAGKQVEGAVQSSFRILRAQSCPPSVRHNHPPRMNAERGSRPLALPSCTENGVQVRCTWLLIRQKLRSAEGGGVRPHGIVGRGVRFFM